MTGNAASFNTDHFVLVLERLVAVIAAACGMVQADAAAQTLRKARRSGSFTEQFYYETWLEQRPELPMVYLPIGWSTYFWSTRLRIANMPEVVALRKVEEVRCRTAELRTREAQGLRASAVLGCLSAEARRTSENNCHGQCASNLFVKMAVGVSWILMCSWVQSTG